MAHSDYPEENAGTINLLTTQTPKHMHLVYQPLALSESSKTSESETTRMIATAAATLNIEGKTLLNL